MAMAGSPDSQPILPDPLRQPLDGVHDGAPAPDAHHPRLRTDVVVNSRTPRKIFGSLNWRIYIFMFFKMCTSLPQQKTFYVLSQ